jgi:hypothetical protein
MEWLTARQACLKEFIQRKDQLSIGFCSCCSYTTCDFVLNALHGCQNHDRSALQASIRSESRQETPSEELEYLCRPRPQEDGAHWFPAVTFRKSSAEKPWNMVVAGNKVSLKFGSDVERKNSAAIATICVQAMGFANWPDGVKYTPFGPCMFSASAYGSHDIKRGALIDLSFSGEYQVMIRASDHYIRYSDDHILDFRRSLQNLLRSYQDHPCRPDHPCHLNDRLVHTRRSSRPYQTIVQTIPVT